MLRLDKIIYLTFYFKYISSAWLSNSLWGSDVLQFLEFINIALIFVLYLHWIHYIVMYFFSVFFFLDAKNIWFVWFYLENLCLPSIVLGLDFLLHSTKFLDKFLWSISAFSILIFPLKGKTWVTSYELRVQIHELWVQIHKLDD